MAITPRNNAGALEWVVDTPGELANVPDLGPGVLAWIVATGARYRANSDDTWVPIVDALSAHEEGGGGAHPDLAAHDTLGLATKTALLDALAGKANTHTHPYSADVHNHDANYSATNHGHTHNHDGVYEVVHSHPYAATGHNHDAAYSAVGHSHANDHVRQHSVTTTADHSFPGGTTNFLRADGVFAAPPGGAGGSRFPVSIAMGGFLTLTNIPNAYDSGPLNGALGICEIDFTGCTSLTFGVRVSKIGTGTQSWQLWNATDGTQLAVIDDAGAVAIKVLTTTVTPGLTGVKQIRVRAKSTVNTDDPVYHGSWVRLSG